MPRIALNWLLQRPTVSSVIIGARNEERLRQNLAVHAASLERQRLLLWILARTGLSASWFLGDGDPFAATGLQIAELAAAEPDL